MKKEIEEIIKNNIVNVNSFMDENGHNRLGEVVSQLDAEFSNRVKEMATAILKDVTKIINPPFEE